MKLSHIKEQFTLGHIALIAGAFLLIGGLTAIQSRDSIANLFSEKTTNADGTNLYYAYVPEPVPNVLGEDTIPDGPAVINEDGTISTLNDFGDVLGSVSDAPQINLDSVPVKISSEQWTAQDYFDATFIIESAIKPGDFESALVSSNSGETQSVINLLSGVQTKLQQMAVPQFATKLHKLKIIQYTVAIDLLKNYYQADSNPEYVSAKLTEFMDMQAVHDEEAENLLDSSN